MLSDAEKNVLVKLIGEDKLSGVLEKAGKNSKTFGDKLKKAAKVGAVALLAVGAAAIKFGADSVRATAEAEASQVKLEDAFKRFPKLADTNIESLRKLNEQLMKKTRFDDDALASGQAILAQFDLTGKQLKNVTPLLADYAAKTEKDLPSAAKVFGKALMGNTRALKEVGIDVELTGNKAKDFTIIQDALNKKVGGFAAKEGKTATGMAERLRNQFGELQEKVGNKLIPVLLVMGNWILNKGIPAISKFAKWVGPRLSATVGRARAFLMSLAKAFQGNGGTMEQVRRIGGKLMIAFEKMKPVLKVLAGVQLAAVKTIFKAIGFVLRNGVLPAIEHAIDKFNIIAGVVERVVKRIKSAWNNLPDFKLNMPDLSKLPGFATGVQNFRGGMALVGERGPEIVNLPRGADVIPNHKLNVGSVSGGSAGGTQITFQIIGALPGSERSIATEIQRLLRSNGVRFAGV